MAKSTKTAAKPTAVTVTYDLMSLPTAQHKAGLAGLLLEIESLRNRGKPSPSYRWDDQCPRTIVHVEFTRETTAALFDDIYDAELIEGPPREKPFTKGKGAQKRLVPPLRRAAFIKTDKKGNQTTVEGYVYLELTPSLATLRHYLPSADWVRLWRDLIWQVIRDSKKKAPFIKRAAAKHALADVIAVADGDTDDEAEAAESGRGDGSSWDDLLKYAAANARGTHAVGKLSGALLLGAMERNAEAIPLIGQIEQNLLLHFWPLSILIFVPRFVDRDGGTYLGRRGKKDRSPHFAVALPEVADLREFLRDYPRLLAGLSTKLAGMRPTESIVDLPAEGGLSFIEHLARLIPPHIVESEVGPAISAVDYFHVAKEGNNVKFLATGRVEPRPHLAEDYCEIAGRPDGKPRFANPFFRRALLAALLDDRPWFDPFADVFDEWPHPFFIPTKSSPTFSWFWVDARKKILEVIQAMPTENDVTDPPSDDDVLASAINRFTRRYLDERLKRDIGFDFHKFRKERRSPANPVEAKNLADAVDARQKLAERLFLEFRSRHDQAFVEHFSGTFFRVGHYMGGKLFERIAAALFNGTDKVKTLTLMALSANSWTPLQPREAKQ
ncbi:MAG TPA: type I-MYXAN CRISPR-associated protein Cmx8 [Pirellulales bacterium]|nr:type I-MYXAN CRISPR-associated protein Cmx8 [Pirellulales bacterium]